MLKSVDEVIDALGGTAATASLVGVGMSAVSNWRDRGAIPAKFFLTISEALGRLGKASPEPSVFTFKAEEARA